MWPRFLTMKTTKQLDAEATQREALERNLDTPRGLTAVIDAKQQEVDDLRTKSNAFLNDIERHFGSLSGFLGQGYLGKSRYENLDDPETRRFAMRWVHIEQQRDSKIMYVGSFAYTATPDAGVRVDYIAKIQGGATLDVINDKYNPEEDNIFKKLTRIDDNFRAVRRYPDHASFLKEGGSPPLWFADFLKETMPPITP